MNTINRRRKSLRLPGYDYAQPGAYFVTLCTWNRFSLFGEIIEGEMHCNDFGRIASKTWEWLPQQYPHIELDAWIVMPNHLHGIVLINEDRRGRSRQNGTGRSRPTPTVGNQLTSAPENPSIDTIDDSMTRKPLGQIIGAFKTVSGKQINLLRKTPAESVWQRSFFEHIIRNERALEEIRSYILNNPMRWILDKDNLATTPISLSTG
jgi:putative transposase